MRKRRVNLATVENKIGRVDCLLHSLTLIGVTKLEEKLELPGLAGGVMPILEKEIRKAVPSKAVIPEEYKELARLVGDYVSR